MIQVLTISYKNIMWNEKSDAMLTKPSPALIEDMKRIKGDIMVMGAGGKMIPQHSCKKAIEAAGIGDRRVIAVSFTDRLLRRCSMTAAWRQYPATFWMRHSVRLLG